MAATLLTRDQAVEAATAALAARGKSTRVDYTYRIDGTEYHVGTIGDDEGRSGAMVIVTRDKAGEQPAVRVMS